MSVTFKDNLGKEFQIKTFPRYDEETRKVDCTIFIEDLEISAKDFVEIISYFMTNQDLEVGDVRIGLKEWISNLDIADGFNKGRKRFIP